MNKNATYTIALPIEQKEDCMAVRPTVDQLICLAIERDASQKGVIPVKVVNIGLSWTDNSFITNQYRVNIEYLAYNELQDGKDGNN